MGTKTYKLSEFINKLESFYGKARTDYEEAAAMLSLLDADHKKLVDSKELNLVGIQRENERYNKKRKEILNKIRTARDTFSYNAGEIRQSVESFFKSNYAVDPNDVDLKACELLKSGMLTDNELLEMAGRYKKDNNMAMYRYCGTFANENDSDPNIRHLALDSKRTMQREDLMLVDSFTDACLKGLRDDITLSNGVDSRHEDFFEAALSSSKDITTTVTVPWATD